MSINLNSITNEKLKSINRNDLPQPFKFLLKGFKYVGEFKEGKLSETNKILALQNLLKDKEVNHHVLLSIAIHTKEYDFAKEIIQKIPEQEVLRSKVLREFKILLDSKLDNTAPQTIIDSNNLHGAEAANIINISSSNLIANNESATVSEKVKQALQYDPNNENSLEISIAAALLDNDKDTAKVYIKQLKEEKQLEVAANYSKDNDAENIEELIEKYEPKEIHSYYQRVKQQKLFELSQKITNNQIISSWKVDNHEIKKDEVVFIKKYKGSNCFAKIAEIIKNKLDNNLIHAFSKALEKGITYYKTGVNGV